MWQHHIPPKHFLLKALSNCYTFALLPVGFFTFDMSWNLSKFIIELHVLPRVFVREYNKKQRRGRIISNLTKGETFSCLIRPGNNLAMWSFFHPSKKGLSFPFSLGKKRIYLETQLKGEFTDLF